MLEMKVLLKISDKKIHYDGKLFIPKLNADNGEVNSQTIFNYHQNENVIWAEYSGGNIIRGHIIGVVSELGILDFHYQHLNKDGQVRIGKCHSTPQLLENGKIELYEEWQWLNGDKSVGTSIIIEQ